MVPCLLQSWAFHWRLQDSTLLRSRAPGGSLSAGQAAIDVRSDVGLGTNLSVHFKWGKESSLVWVTTLDEGRPAPEARVAVHDCLGKVLWSGQTDAQGIARVGKLPSPEALAACPYEGNLYHYNYKQAMAINCLDGGLFVIASVELLPYKSWNLLDAMMGRRGYRVQTATAQMEVVGKRHYGLKALPQGSGGKQLTREPCYSGKDACRWMPTARRSWKSPSTTR
jgi:Bacterial alpha-2-macroglobulin MG3 domain